MQLNVSQETLRYNMLPNPNISPEALVLKEGNYYYLVD